MKRIVAYLVLIGVLLMANGIDLLLPFRVQRDQKKTEAELRQEVSKLRKELEELKKPVTPPRHCD